ncbi:MAG TPA: type II toxin-antitoxin system PemK/MazF family toxin [Candidatus Paceibacterota bacterium]
MQKDFDGWNKSKKDIHNSAISRLYQEREAWWCSIGLNVGFEEDGKDKEFQRPVLILKGFSSSTCLIAPLTTSLKVHKYRVYIGKVDGKSASVILSQIRVVDTKRLINKIAKLDKNLFKLVRKTIKDLL